MTTAFKTAIATLTAVHQRFHNREISPVQHGSEREAALAQALVEMAKEQGVTLQQPLHIDSNGEFSIVALKPGTTHSLYEGCAKFGEVLAKALTENKARCGIIPATLTEDAGWCRLNHFGAERMVLAYATGPSASA